jgi:hypothetical protein
MSISLDTLLFSLARENNLNNSPLTKKIVSYR